MGKFLLLKPVFFRVLLLLGGLLYLGALARNGVEQWLLGRPTAENLARGIRWFPANPELWKESGRSRLSRLDDTALREAAEAYEEAVARNPLDPSGWEGLATAYIRLGEPRKAEAALRAHLVAMPHSPSAAWRLANFLLVQDRMQEAFPFFRTAAAHNKNLLLPAFDLGWKLLGDPQLILEELVPSDVESRMSYLNFLVWRKGALAEAYSVWKEIRPSRTEAVIRLGNSYAEELAGAGMGAEADQVWKELLQDTGRVSARPPGEAITNGDFEMELPNAGLDWRLTKGEGYQIALDNFVFQHGTRSLRVTFDGTSNLEFGAVRQMIPVKPNQSYRFQGYIKTENISTGNGLFFSLSSRGAPAETFWERTTENRIGTTTWTREQTDFRTGPNNRVVQVVLSRRQSTKLDNLIQGKVWIDNLSLTTLTP